MANRETLGQHLKEIDACEPARQWAKGMRASEAWEKCERPEWLIWWIHNAGGDCQPARRILGGNCPCEYCMERGVRLACCADIRATAKCPWREPKAKKAVAKINRQIQGAKV